VELQTGELRTWVDGWMADGRIDVSSDYGESYTYAEREKER